MFNIADWENDFHGQWQPLEASHDADAKAFLWKSVESPCFGYLLESCTSTLDVAVDLIKKKTLPQWSWVLSTTQTKGRGQVGSWWISPPGNLFASIRLPDSSSVSGQLLPLTLGIIWVEIFRKMGCFAEVKWPNDILMGRTKVGGILIEQHGDRIIAGMGINLKGIGPLHGTGGRAGTFRLPPGNLQQFGLHPPLSGLWRAATTAFEKRLSQLQADPDQLIDAVGASLAFKDEKIIVSGSDIWNGPAILRRISSTGGIVIETTEGKTLLNRGRITPVIS